MTLQLTSPAFTDGGIIPARHTCDGADVNPPLSIAGAPPGTVSLVLLVDDPDAPDPKAPRVVWDHWVVWNLPARSSAIAEGGAAPGAVVGTNSWGRRDYGGPCPPVGTHRYFFKLYALDRELDLAPASTKKDVEGAMEGAILARAQLMGRYRKRS